jgi:hypothetical protein
MDRVCSQEQKEEEKKERKEIREICKLFVMTFLLLIEKETHADAGIG